MKTIVGILNYYLNPIFNNDPDICVQLTRVSWWVFGNFITIWIETKCWAEGQDVTTITSWSHHLSDFFIWKLKFKAPSGTIGKAFECVSCLTRDPLNFFPNLIRGSDSKQLSPSPLRILSLLLRPLAERYEHQRAGIQLMVPVFMRGAWGKLSAKLTPCPLAPSLRLASLIWVHMGAWGSEHSWVFWNRVPSNLLCLWLLKT